jgi:ubiquinone/menaquinone biosynthesis C-methylase UbiE
MQYNKTTYEEFEMTKNSQACTVLRSLCLTILFSTQLSAHGQKETDHKTYHLHTIFSNKDLKQKFSGFLTHVLRQLSAEKFYELVDSQIMQPQAQDDAQIYRELLQKLPSIKPYFPFYKKLQALKNQKKELTRQALELLTDIPTISNCLEIGTPGTYANAISKHIPISGTLYAMNEKKQLTDAVQAPSYNPLKGFTAYDIFLPLNNYEPISNQVPDKSIDLVICFIGLHHIPLEKIDAFIASIHRVLRPGGVFLLRDHDCKDAQMESIISSAHSIFNIIMNQDSLATEQAEFRNFQKLNYWIELLEKNGFETDHQRVLQAGDPTLNTMLKFTKKAVTHDDTLATISHDLQHTKDYKLDILQTYLTAPEWYNVDSSQEYGKFIEHTPFYNFPYLNNVKNYWKIFNNSWRVARSKQGTLALLTSPYTLMSIFIGAFMTIEYSAKALISWPIRAMYNVDPSPIKVLIEDPLHEISNVDARINLLKEYSGTSFALVELPRNKEFFQIIEKLEKSEITLQEIAGQKEILVKVLVSDNHSIPELEGCRQEYRWKVPTKPSHSFIALTVDATKLKNVLKSLKQQDIQILHIHDF